MPELTPLQRTLQEGQYARTFREVAFVFKKAGIDLEDNLEEALENTADGETFTILEAGSGAGVALLGAIQRARIRHGHRLKIQGIGVDLSPLPHILPKYFADSECLEELRRMGLLVKANAEELPIKDESIDFGFSVATVQYVRDSLRAIEESHRGLKNDREFHWLLSTVASVSFLPTLHSILKNTPGSYDSLGLIDWSDDFHDVLTVRRHGASQFDGFPYDLSFTFPSLLHVGARKFMPNRVYRKRK